MGRLAFLDEDWASTAMTPSRGRSPKGTRCRGQAPYGHWHTTTFVGALRACRLVAPWVLDGPIKDHVFRAWVQQALLPVRRPGDIVVMDNLSSYKIAGVQEAIEAAGTQLRYLPPYGPDYNPIEPIFAKFKILLRKTARRRRSGLSAIVCSITSPPRHANVIFAMPAMPNQDETALVKRQEVPTTCGEVIS